MENTEAILVVDDHEEIQFYTEQILEDAGYRVLVASDGIEALEVLSSSESVALILADIAMPRMNGYQLYEEIIQNPDWVAIPFVFLTARAMDSDIRFGKELGVDDYMTKPFNPDDLVAVVRGRLRRAQQLASVSQHVVTEAGDARRRFDCRCTSNRHQSPSRVVPRAADSLVCTRIHAVDGAGATCETALYRSKRLFKLRTTSKPISRMQERCCVRSFARCVASWVIQPAIWAASRTFAASGTSSWPKSKKESKRMVYCTHCGHPNSEDSGGRVLSVGLH